MDVRKMKKQINTTSIRISHELITFLRKNATYGESINDVIWRLIKPKEKK